MVLNMTRFRDFLTDVSHLPIDHMNTGGIHTVLDSIEEYFFANGFRKGPSK